jgi:hypothetical protein
MSDEKRLSEEHRDGKSLDRFRKMTKALFRVDKRDVPKHHGRTSVLATNRSGFPTGRA